MASLAGLKERHVVTNVDDLNKNARKKRITCHFHQQISSAAKNS